VSILFTDSILSKGAHAGKVNRTAKDSEQWPVRQYANCAMVIPDLVTAFASKYADFIFSKYSQHDQQNEGTLNLADSTCSIPWMG